MGEANTRGSRSKRRVTRWLLLSALLAAVVISTGASLLRRPEVTAAMRGKALARDLGCFACHGPAGSGGVANPGAASGRVPGWTHSEASLYLREEGEIREWILQGAPKRLAGDEARGLLPMPAYEGAVSEGDVDDLIAYFQAVAAWYPEVPDDVFEGRKISERLGCFGCHGPSGMGGVPNPGSFKGHIPPWDGDEFLELVADDDELRTWILVGTLERLERDPLAKHFLDGQLIKMPAYEGRLSAAELEKTVRYIRWLRSTDR